MGPIFDEKLLKSLICGTREQCTGALFIVDLLTIAGWTKKKKKKEEEKNADYKTQTPN